MSTSRRYKENEKLVVEDKLYSPKEAIKQLKSAKSAKFDETVECHFRLGVDPRHADQQIRGTMSLIHGTGKTVKIAALCEEASASRLLELGAVVAGEESVIEQISSGVINFDILITAPKMMPKLGKHAKILGPKGLMPSPKNGRIGNDLEKLFSEFVGGKVEYKNDKSGIIHLSIGKLSFEETQLEENFTQFYDLILKLKPTKVKGTYMKSISLSSSMGPGFFVETQKPRWEEIG